VLDIQSVGSALQAISRLGARFGAPMAMTMAGIDAIYLACRRRFPYHAPSASVRKCRALQSFPRGNRGRPGLVPQLQAHGMPTSMR